MSTAIGVERLLTCTHVFLIINCLIYFMYIIIDHRQTTDNVMHIAQFSINVTHFISLYCWHYPKYSIVTNKMTKYGPAVH